VSELLTIGHSNHEAEHFAALLSAARIEVVADVRSWPHSRYATWAAQDQLADWLRGRGHRYVFLGHELGGRPTEPDCYDAAGHVLYGRVARLALFAEGLERLRAGLETFRVAVMCSEEDPTHCHRRLLVAKVLLEQGIAITHVRGDGRLESETGVAPEAANLFDDEDLWWRSTRSVSRRRPLSASSAG
jgi:uncharacterized protein (DUF488 family)